jgi:uncharacterized protein YndB with AHSA1/START domain
MNAIQARSTDTQRRELVISRLLDAPREMVWAAWTDPKQVGNWWGPKGFTTTIHEMDVRPGGIWRQTMHGPDGADYPNKSVFKEVVAPERIVYSHGGGKQGGKGHSFEATWTFEQQEGNKTLLTIHMVFPTQEDRDLVIQDYNALEGGKQTLGRLSVYLDDVVRVERVYDAPAAVVWRALTDLEQMKQWYFPQLSAFEPEVGFETRVDVEHEGKVYIHYWKVTEAVPNKKIAYRWRYPDVPGDSVVSFELFPEGDKTRLVLTHTGLASFQGKQHPDYASRNFFGGWSHFAVALGDFVAKQK